jgi:large conductance mechanosensitive channel
MTTNIIKNVSGDIGNFINFINKKNVLDIALAFIISTNINSITNSFIDNIILPILNRIFSNETNNISLKDKKVLIFGINFEIGGFLSAVLKFILLLYVMYTLFKVANKV